MTGLLKLENVRIGGSIATLGALLWILSFFNLVGWAVLLLALILFLVGWFRRSAPLLMPSAILTGIGVGTIFTQTALSQLLLRSPDYRGSLFIFCCAGGWLLVTVLTSNLAKPQDEEALAPKEPSRDGAMYWVLIPCLLMIILGFLSVSNLFYAGLLRRLLIFVSQNWHITLLALGAYIIIDARDNRTI